MGKPSGNHTKTNGKPRGHVDSMGFLADYGPTNSLQVINSRRDQFATMGDNWRDQFRCVHQVSHSHVH